MKKHNWFKLSQDTGDTAMSQGELEEAHGGNIPSGATLGGFRWTTHYMELTLPTTIDPNKILISALKNKKTPEEIAAVAYTEAFYATQKAQDLAKKLNTTNPQEIQNIYMNLYFLVMHIIQQIHMQRNTKNAIDKAEE